MSRFKANSSDITMQYANQFRAMFPTLTTTAPLKSAFIGTTPIGTPLFCVYSLGSDGGIVTAWEEDYAFESATQMQLPSPSTQLDFTPSPSPPSPSPPSPSRRYGSGGRGQSQLELESHEDYYGLMSPARYASKNPSYQEWDPFVTPRGRVPTHVAWGTPIKYLPPQYLADVANRYFRGLVANKSFVWIPPRLMTTINPNPWVTLYGTRCPVVAGTVHGSYEGNIVKCDTNFIPQINNVYLYDLASPNIDDVMRKIERKFGSSKYVHTTHYVPINGFFPFDF